jgi:5,10-methylene-tetrahydrofolate dehydrogenase/methenyl tetrahydrofolate cyclohydrolase
MAKLIDGKQIAADIRGELKMQIIEWVAAGNRAPQLTAVLIGDDPASSTYVNNKMKVSKLRQSLLIANRSIHMIKMGVICLLHTITSLSMQR